MSSTIWIRVCVCLLLFIPLEVYASSLDAGNVNPGIDTVKILRQNIPSDYKIHINYLPKKEAGMCWVTLNLYDLEKSLEDLKSKFGDKASNKEDIGKLVEILQALRIQIKQDLLEEILMTYQCHFQSSAWHREQYFDFVEEILKAAQNEESVDDCDEPPACPSTQQPGTTDGPTTAPPPPTPTPTCESDCGSSKERLMSEIVERSLFSLLFIPLVALIVLLVWRVRSRRNKEVERNPGENGPFTGTEGTAPPLNGDVSERNNLNVSETV
ncbi:kit ligand a isoform X3 [Betta splendens]|uniref:Kit ligand n=1 Tax=Betta splendens TaxID=158456 RepID=A0A6P7MSR4_BETSP|nr:kit ligand a isoform X3 [Betta splendens]